MLFRVASGPCSSWLLEVTLLHMAAAATGIHGVTVTAAIGGLMTVIGASGRFLSPVGNIGFTPGS